MRKLSTVLLAVAAGAALPLLLAAQKADGEDPKAFRVELAEFQRLQAEGSVAVLDVRNPEAFAESHVPGAISMPLDSIDMKIDQLRRLDRPIVTYCRCHQEATSLLAAQRLGRYGVEGARALVGGFDVWVDAGGAVESGRPTNPAASEQD